MNILSESSKQGPRAPWLPVVLFLLPMPALSLAAQESISWSDFAPCRSCELELRRVVSMGELRGPGVIESSEIRVVAAPGRGYMVYGMAGGGGHRFSLFDERGAFLRTIGREGDGPGELREIAGLSFAGDDRLIVLDHLRRFWITFRENGEFVGETRAERLEAGRFRLVDGGERAVVAVMGRRPESGGLPLHLVDLRTGAPLRHFGAEDPAWHIGHPYGGSVNLGESGPGSEGVWFGRVGSPHIEQWSLEGSLLRSFSGSVDWFPVVPPSDRTNRSPPPVAMIGVGIDGRNRLWMLTIVPDARWREVPSVGPEGSVAHEYEHMYMDARLDVFDLVSRRHLGHMIFDDPFSAQLLARGSSVLVSMVEYETPVWPRAVVYEVEITGASGRR